MMSGVAGRHVVISGGSRGLGEAIVGGLLSAGYRVSTFSRSSTPFIEEVQKNSAFFFAPADLANFPSVASFLKESEKHFGPPYGLINCAAIAVDGLLATLAESAIQKVLSINAEGTLRFTRLAVRRMLSARSGGVILNISSVSSLRGFKGLSAYAFTKGGLDAFTRSLARELGEQKIRVNSVAPGYYDTEMSRNLDADQKAQIERRTPLGRLGTPEDVVGAVLFLLSDQASFITGQLLTIDGGASV
jgi:3-oxoacyl-[acyl-carrier protein] reductase